MPIMYSDIYVSGQYLRTLLSKSQRNLFPDPVQPCAERSKCRPKQLE